MPAVRLCRTVILCRGCGFFVCPSRYDRAFDRCLRCVAGWPLPDETGNSLLLMDMATHDLGED